MISNRIKITEEGEVCDRLSIALAIRIQHIMMSLSVHYGAKYN